MVKESKVYFYKILLGYEQTFKTEDIKNIFQYLLDGYNKNDQGQVMAFHILSLAWETGQVMRIMFLDHLKPCADN